MSSFLFYDPREYHSVSQIDPDIIFIQNQNILIQHTAPNPNILLQIVCICCEDLSSVIDPLTSHEHEHVIAIYPCKCLGNSETNEVFSGKVHRDISFTQYSGWELKGRAALLEACMERQYNQQVQDELQRIRYIQENFLPRPHQPNQAVE